MLKEDGQTLHLLAYPNNFFLDRTQKFCSNTTMKKITRCLPSAITLGNLFCGFLAISYIEDNFLVKAAWLIFLGMIFDMFDGKVARMTDVSSDFGMQLDSLTDMITFGVAPAFLIKVYLLESGSPMQAKLVWGVCLFFVMCAALRLARFNTQTEPDEESHSFFYGLATPGGAGLLASLVLVADFMIRFLSLELYTIILMCAPVFIGTLMISQIRYVHFGSFLVSKHMKLTLLLISSFVLLGVVFNLFTVFLSCGFLFYAFSGPLNEIKLRLSYYDDRKDELAGAT